jgi:hypothetical protein
VLLRGGHLGVDGSQIFADTRGGVDGTRLGIDLRVTADALITNRALITTESSGAGHGGDLRLTAGHLHIDNATLGTRAVGSGNSGNLTLRVETLTLTGDAQVNSSSSSAGRGGSVTVTATETISISGPNSGLFSGASGWGPGGDITIHARELRLNEGAILSATSLGTGDAGRLTITLTERFRSDHSTITARAAQANGGEIALQAGQGVLLWDNSTITASVGGGPATVGGNLTITAPFVALEGSQIIAQATEGTGGRIAINAPVLLAEPALAEPTG